MSRGNMTNNWTKEDYLYDGSDSLSPLNLQRVKECDFILEDKESMLSLFKNFPAFKQQVLDSNLSVEEKKEVLQAVESDAYNRARAYQEHLTRG